MAGGVALQGSDVETIPRIVIVYKRFDWNMVVVALVLLTK